MLVAHRGHVLFKTAFALGVLTFPLAMSCSTGLDAEPVAIGQEAAHLTAARADSLAAPAVAAEPTAEAEATDRLAPAGNHCFYYCRWYSDYPDGYWEYSSFSDCTANRCDLNGQSSAGSCTPPANINGTCTDP